MIETTVPKINVADVMARVRATVAEIREREKQHTVAEQQRAAEEQQRAAEEQRRIVEEQLRAAEEQVRAAKERRAAAEQRAQQLRQAEEESLSAEKSAPFEIDVKPPPPPYRAKPVEAHRERLLQAVKEAHESTEPKSWIPKPLRRFFRRQSSHNRLVLDAITVLAKTNAQLATRVQQLSDVDHVQHEWLKSLLPQMHSLAGIARTRASQKLVDAMRMRLDMLDGDYRSNQERRDELDQAYRGEFDRAGEHLRHLQDEVDRGLHEARVRDDEGRARDDEARARADEARARADAHAAQLDALSSRITQSSEFLGALSAKTEIVAGKIEALAVDLAHAGAHLRNLQIEVDRLNLRSTPIDTQIGQLQGQLGLMREEMNHAGEHVRHLDVELRRALDDAGRDAIERKIGMLEQRMSDDASFLKTEISQHRLTLSRLLSSGGSGSSAGESPARPAVESGLLDAFYVAFEDRFRGRRAEIKERVRFYLPLLREAAAGTNDRAVLDLGCGRGEWLELLQEEKINASGVDLNAAMVTQCAGRGLQAIEADALSHLQSLPDASLGAVTGFHIIEHLPFEVLMNLLAQTLRVLRPGGVAIFESPNCKNLVVGASTFNLDPTHRNPVFPETAEFMLQLQGFTRTELRYLAPAEGSPFDAAQPESAYLNERFFGPQDFSVIGYRASA